MAEEDVVVIPAPPTDLKRKLEEVEPEVTKQHVGSNGVDGTNSESDSSQAKRPKLDDEAPERLDNGKTQENGSMEDVKDDEKREEEKHEEELKQEETKKLSAQNDEDSAVLVEVVKETVDGGLNENTTRDVDQFVDDHVKPEDNKQSSSEAPVTQENIVEESNDDGNEPRIDEESKESNDDASQNENDKENKELGDEPRKEVDDTQSTTCRIDVPSSKVGVLIGKGGETIRYLQFNSGAKIQILRDSEADPNSVLRPVDIIGTVTCIENAKKLIDAVIAEAEAGGSPALVARGQHSTHTGISEQIEIKVPNDKVGIIIGRGGETIKNMQTRSGARIQLIPQHPQGDGIKERTVRISGNRRQIDIATDMIRDVMDQNARPYSGGYNQPAHRPQGPGGPPQWGSQGPHAPHPMPYDYHHRGPYSSRGSHYNSPSYSGYPPQHMHPRSGYGAGWDQRPPHSGPYDYYGRQGAHTPGPLPPPSAHGPSPALGPPPPSQVSYGYGQNHGPEYAPYSQTGHQQTYGQRYEQPTYDNNPSMPPYGGSYPPAGGGQPGYPQMQQPGVRPYGGSYPPAGSGQPGYPSRPAAAASSGDVPYQGATPGPAAPSYGGTNMATQQQQYGYTSSGGPTQQQSYPSYSSAPPSDGYNNGTQTPASGPAYQQQSVQAASSAHDQPGAQQAAAGGYGGQVAPPGGYSSYPSSQPAYGTAPTQNSGSYGYNTSAQDPNYGYGGAPGSQPTYAQAAPTQGGYEQQAATQPAAGYGAAPGSTQVKTQSPQAAYAQYDASQVYAAPQR